MGTSVRPVVILVTIGVLVVACGGSTNAPTPTLTLTPIAVSPNNNALISQNNPATGCALPATDPLAGFGFQIQFQWVPPSQANGIVGYEVYAINSTAPIPVLDTTVPTTAYTMTACDAYVVDRFLQGWQWRVRAQNAQGQFADWSPWATYEFTACRLSDGTPCR